MMRSVIGLKLKTYVRLGPMNILRVAVYRVGIRLKIHPIVRAKMPIAGKYFFRNVNRPDDSFHISNFRKDTGLLFGWYAVPLRANPPKWHANPFTGTRVKNADLPWWQLPDFDLNAGDIKTIWEASRFDWVLTMAQCACSGYHRSCSRLNYWLSDWSQSNQAYFGPNWKCGQEASIRIMHLAMAAHLMRQEHEPCSDLIQLIVAHLVRIKPTLSYAIAQDNNHGTSEAAALFIGGSWVHAQGHALGKHWEELGRRCFENRVKRLIETDGSFSQYSLNYHRMLLDTISMAEIWRQWQSLPPFSSLFYERARAAARWLYLFVNPTTGDAPNLGANDGTRLLPLTDTEYRDFRPSVQLAMAVFEGKRAYSGQGEYNTPFSWLDIPLPDKTAVAPGSVQLDDGGYAILRSDGWMVLLRYPKYRFRPSHCDALHLDVWHGADNFLVDGGSFSYNTDATWMNYFSGTAGHNTVQFDDREQMPRIGRFLLGQWLQAQHVAPLEEQDNSVTASAGYRDSQGAYHHRSVCLNTHGMSVNDQVSGFNQRAVLRWRLRSGDWRLENGTLRCERYSISVASDVPITRLELVKGWESRYYMKKTPLLVLEVEIHSAGHFMTEINIQ
jgi:hypothetical protein